MRRPLLVFALVLVAVLGLSATASALPADKHLVVEADNGESCAGEGKTDCFRVTEGSLDGFEQGMRVHVMLENVGSAPHNIYVTEQANADGNNVDTAADDAINGSETIEQGETTNLTFTVPDDAEGLYFWCDVDTHEALGMWMETSVAEASTEEPDNGTDDGGTGDEQAPADEGADEEGEDDVGRFLPAPGLTGALVAVVVAATVVGSARRR